MNRIDYDHFRYEYYGPDPAMKTDDPDLSVTIGGTIFLQTPIYNASGVWCTTDKELQAVLDNPFSGAVITKSCTILQREGNPKPRYSSFMTTSSINSMGLPNKGLDYYVDTARYLNPIKPYFISIAGLTQAENLQMLSVLQHDSITAEAPISGVELNLSCPNLPGKPQIGYDFDAMDETLRCSFEMFDRLPLGVKLPPYFDPIHFDMASDILRHYPELKWVTCINSIGNGLVVDPINEVTLIHPKDGLGGIGGAVVKSTALANVRNFRKRLPITVDVIGCGGIVRGTDVFEHILCGATAVQVGTALAENGIGIFQSLTTELIQFMKIKGYKSLVDFRGKLKIKEHE